MKKRLVGVVVSDKMQKTVVVKVSGIKVHPLYRKRFHVFKKYKAHTGEQSYKVGDCVVIEQTRPLSKEKRWRVIKKVTSQAITNQDNNETFSEKSAVLDNNDLVRDIDNDEKKSASTTDAPQE